VGVVGFKLKARTKVVVHGRDGFRGFSGLPVMLEHAQK
jgi:hypothetical protein